MVERDEQEGGENMNDRERGREKARKGRATGKDVRKEKWMDEEYRCLLEK